MIAERGEIVQHVETGAAGLVRGGSSDGTTLVLWLEGMMEQTIADDQLRWIEPVVVKRMWCPTCGEETGQQVRDGFGTCPLCNTRNPAGDLSAPIASRSSDEAAERLGAPSW